MKKLTTTLGLAALMSAPMLAQEFTIGADFRTRAEFNNGQKTLIAEGAKPETTIFSRARLNLEYKSEKIDLKFAPQDIRVWGDGGSIQGGNDNLTVYEAWAKYKFSDKSSLKVGRQPLVYDDQRLLGGLDWAMPGRSHDAILYSTKTGENSKLDLAATYNNDGIDGDEINGKEIYGVTDGGEKIKSAQLLHYSTKSDGFKFSALALNTILQNSTSGVHYDYVTLGINPEFQLGESSKLFGSAYLQTGVDTAGDTKEAFQASLNYNLKTGGSSFTLGGEILSGDDDEAGKQKAFSPLYGTNHKFNGYMDYFYVGNHFKNAGLMDLYLKTAFKLSDKTTLKGNLHFLSAHKDIAGASSKSLGTELDLVVVSKVAPGFSIVGGHSHMFASDAMETLKGVSNPEGLQNWTWIMLVFKPKLFSSK